LREGYEKCHGGGKKAENAASENNPIFPEGKHQKQHPEASPDHPLIKPGCRKGRLHGDPEQSGDSQFPQEPDIYTIDQRTTRKSAAYFSDHVIPFFV